MDRADYCSPPEAAKIMMCSAMHVRELMNDQQLPCYKVGNRRYIPRSAVKNYVEKHTVIIVQNN